MRREMIVKKQELKGKETETKQNVFQELQDENYIFLLFQSCQAIVDNLKKLDHQLNGNPGETKAPTFLKNKNPKSYNSLMIHDFHDFL